MCCLGWNTHGFLLSCRILLNKGAQVHSKNFRSGVGHTMLCDWCLVRSEGCCETTSFPSCLPLRFFANRTYIHK